MPEQKTLERARKAWEKKKKAEREKYAAAEDDKNTEAAE